MSDAVPDLSFEEQTAAAIANLASAVSCALAGAGLAGPLATMLETFEVLNQSVLPPGPLAEMLQKTVDVHLEELRAAVGDDAGAAV